MLPLLVAAALLFAGVDGSPWESVTAYQPAVKVATECVTDADTCNPPLTAPRAEWRYCEEWHELAAEVGWPESQAATLSYVMHRESRCNPGAYNPQSCGGGNHAIGLMQLCGWGGRELFDPETNLRKALELWHRSGWHPWCLPRDPVTPRC